MPAKAIIPGGMPPRQVLCSYPREDCDNAPGMHQDIPEPTIILSMNAHQDPAAHPAGPTPALWPLVARRPLPRIHVISDVHLEFGPYELPADLDFDILVASGDIGPVEDAVRWLAKCGKPVVYVMGNHEYYDREFDEVLPAARAAARGTRVHVLERNAVTIQGVRFLGTTLWTSFGDWHPGLVDQAYRQMNDYELIRATRWFESSRNLAWYRRQCRAAHLALPEDDPALAADSKFHPAISYQEHLRSVTWLNRMLDRPFDGPTVVVTHHSPTFRSLAAFGITAENFLPANWNGDTLRDDLRRVAAYASPLDALLARHRDDIDLWTHGHLHAGLDVISQGVRVLCNPRGYAFERGARAPQAGRDGTNPLPGRAPDFDWRYVVDLEDGLARPLQKALAMSIVRMCRQVEEAAELVPHMLDDDSVPTRSVREAFARRVAVFGRQLDAILRTIEEAIDAGTESSPIADLSPPSARPAVVTSPVDAHRQVELMQEWIEWTAQLPRAAGEALHAWRVATRTMLQTARDLGIDARCTRLPTVALRSLVYARVHVLHVVETPEMTGKLGRQLTALFGNARPRRAIRLKRVAAGALDSDDLLTLADVEASLRGDVG